MQEIGFKTHKQEAEDDISARLTLLEKRVAALEKGEPNYLQYLKLKSQFEGEK